MVMYGLVEDEYHGNVQNVVDEAVAHVRSADRRIQYLAGVANVVIPNSVQSLQFGNMNLAARIKVEVDALVNDCETLERSDTFKIAAMNRVSAKIAPAKSGQEAKDCEIIESYLALSNALQAAGFTQQRVFVSSNSKDYLENGQVHPDLDPVFRQAGLEYAAEIAWAHNLVGSP